MGYYLTITDDGNGTPSGGNDYYDVAAEVWIDGFPFEGYLFSHWSGDTQYLTLPVDISYNSVVMPEADIALQANFGAAITLTLTDATIDGNGASGEFLAGTEVPITAAKEGYTFDHWSGDTDYLGSSTTTNPNTALMNNLDGVLLVANYTPNDYTLTLTDGTIDGNGTYGDYNITDTVDIAADAPDEGYEFDCWTGDTQYLDDANSATATVTMLAASVSLTATYELITYALTVTDGTGGGDFAPGATPAISATVSEGHRFAVWTGDTDYVDDPDSAETFVTMPAQAVAVTATFTDIFDLTVTNGDGDGQYAEGETPAITADSPAEGYRFKEWTGDTDYVADVNSSSTTVTMPAQAVGVEATYEPIPTHDLTVVNGSGSGTFYEGQTVDIVADAPPEGQVFREWTGDTEGVANVKAASTTFTMGTSAATVTAGYAARPRGGRLALLDAN